MAMQVSNVQLVSCFKTKFIYLFFNFEAATLTIPGDTKEGSFELQSTEVQAAPSLAETPSVAAVNSL